MNHRFAYENILYPYDQIVAFKSCPVIIKLDPAFVFKDIIGNGSIQFIQIQVKVPTVLIDLTTVWGLSDSIAVKDKIMNRKTRDRHYDIHTKAYIILMKTLMKTCYIPL